MIYTEHKNAESFLSLARAALERKECVNGLMLGVCLRLMHEPNAYGDQPFLATIESSDGLRIAAVMTPPYKLQVYSADNHTIDAFEMLAEALLRGQWSVPGIIAPASVADMFASVWSRRAGVYRIKGMKQGVHELRKVIHPQYPAGELRQASAEDNALVRQWAREFHIACFGDDQYERTIKAVNQQLANGTLFFWVNNKPVSMAARTRPTPNGEAIGLVYSPPAQRRNGYATAVVASLSQIIIDEGKDFCTLYTDLNNTMSNSVYRKIGYLKIAEVVDINFENKADNASLHGTR